MSEQAQADKCRIVTPEFRVSYPHVFKPQSMPGTNNPPKYSVTGLVPKDSDMIWMTNLIREAKIAKFGPNKADWPKCASPVADGDDESQYNKKTGKPRDGYAGHWVIKMSTNEDSKPGVVGPDGKEILEASKFYAGCYARAYVYAYVWEFPKNSGRFGVGLILDHVQKTREGKSFGGKRPASEVFGPVSSAMSDDESDTEENFM